MIRKVGISDVRRTGRLLLQRSRKTKVLQRSMQLPAGKNLKTNVAEQPKRNNVFASTKCSEYEGYDYCTPLFP